MANEITCHVISPEKILYSESVEFVVCPMEDGEMGILADHAPFLGAIGMGLVKINNGKEEIKFAVDAGFVEVRENEVSILVTRARTREDIQEGDLANRLADLKKDNLGDEKIYHEIAWIKTQEKLLLQ